MCVCVCVFCHISLHVGSYFLDQGLNMCPLYWKHGVLITGLPGKFPEVGFFKEVIKLK